MEALTQNQKPEVVEIEVRRLWLPNLLRMDAGSYISSEANCAPEDAPVGRLLAR